MKKTMSLYLAFASVAILFGFWLRSRSNIPFVGFDGAFVCRNFGLPDANHNTFRFQAIDDRLFTVEASAGENRRPIGRAKIESSSLLRFELGMDLVHSPNLSLNPLAEHFFEGHGRQVDLVGRLEGREIYRQSCLKAAL